MSERWWRRRRRFYPWFGDFIDEADEADETEKKIDDIVREAFSDSIEGNRTRKHFARQLGGSQPTLIRSLPNGKYEPLLDVFDEKTHVVVVVELLGVDQDSIRINALEETLSISVESPERSYYKEISLPAKIDPKSSSASCKNGVLEIRLLKRGGERLLVR